MRRMRHGEDRIAGWEEYHLEVDDRSQVKKPYLFVIEGSKS